MFGDHKYDIIYAEGFDFNLDKLSPLFTLLNENAIFGVLNRGGCNVPTSYISQNGSIVENIANLIQPLKYRNGNELYSIVDQHDPAINIDYNTT
jgi:hypothetical protein